MKLALHGTTALQFWRACDVTAQRLNAQTEMDIDFAPSLSQAEYKYLSSRFGMQGRICSLAGNSAGRRNSQFLKCYSNAKSQPVKLVHLGKQFYASGPGSTIAQIAAILAAKTSHDEQRTRDSVVTMCVIMSELAGNYRLSPTLEDGFRKAHPLVTLQDVRRMLEENPPFPGKGIARKALDYSIERSNSPAETQLALFEILPKSWGGAGMTRPELNQRIVTNVDSSRKTRFGDQCWEKEKRIVEYNGGYHEGERANDDDARRNALIARGYTVNVINKNELHNAAALESVLKDIAKCVGSEGRRTSDFSARRARMRSVVFETCGTLCHENRGILVPEALKATPYTPTRL